MNISCEYANLHRMSFITTKFHKILLSGFKGVARTNSFSTIFNFAQISMLKGDIILTKNGMKISCKYLHLCSMPFKTTNYKSFTKFCWAVSEELRSQKTKQNKNKNKKTVLADWKKDWSKTLYPPQLVALGIIKWNYDL